MVQCASVKGHQTGLSPSVKGTPDLWSQFTNKISTDPMCGFQPVREVAMEII